MNDLSTNNIPVQSSEKTKKPRSGTKGLLIALLVAVLLSVALSVTNLVFTLRSTASLDPASKTEDKKEEEEKKSEKEEETEYDTYEDGIVIADQYTILPTTKISKAYLTSDTSGLTDKEKETLELASEVIDECIDEDMSDYDKEKAIYDWMVENLTFDDGALTVIPTTSGGADTPYGVLKYRNAVCVGYATTFRLFMEMLEIPCRIVPNSEHYHSWNLVQLDGEWYHTDVYSATGVGDYSYFNITDGMCYESWNTSEFPEAVSIKYNPIFKDAVKCRDVFDIPKTIREALDDQTPYVSFRFEKDTDDEIISIAENIAARIENTCIYEDVYYHLDMWHSWIEHDGEYLLVVYITAYEDEEDHEDDMFELSEEDTETILDSLEDAFGDIIDRGAFEDSYYYDDEEEYREDEYWDEEDLWDE